MNSTMQKVMCYQTLLFFGLLVIFGGFVNADQTNSPIERNNASNLTENLPEASEIRKFVKNMMLDSWNGWGYYAVQPIANISDYGIYLPNARPGTSIVASMSTLWTMGLKDEFEKGKKWIETDLDLSQIDKVENVHDVVVNFVGALLSCYSLTGDSMFLDKAKEIGEILQPAFSTNTGLPHKEINFSTKITNSNVYSDLSDVSGFQLEFNYLSDASGDTKFRHQIARMQKALRDIAKPFYYELVDINEKQFRSGKISMFKESSKLYSSLVKSYIQSNLQDTRSIQMYKEAVDATVDRKLFDVFPNGLHYVRNFVRTSNKPFELYMDYSACYLGAMLSLGSNAMKLALNKTAIDFNTKHEELHRIQSLWKLAEQITETCNRASDGTLTGLGPSKFSYEAQNVKIKEAAYELTPELAESNFILWRLTHSEKYRVNAWKMAQALQRHARAESGGYSVVKDVNKVPTFSDLSILDKDTQPPMFLSATLKYLYLTFTDDDVLPLEKWVFTSVGHPLPICGNNSVYAIC